MKRRTLIAGAAAAIARPLLTRTVVCPSAEEAIAAIARGHRVLLPAGSYVFPAVIGG